MTKMGALPEFQKPHVAHPVVNTLADIDPQALVQLGNYLEQFPPAVPASSIQGLGTKVTGGTSTQTPGAVAVVNIAHGLAKAPSGYSVTPGNANARGAPLFHVTADAANIILTFAANLTAATPYVWVWTAVL